MVDLKISLVERFGWTLRDIDETDIDSLLPFVYRLAERNRFTELEKKPPPAYCDQVSWL